MPKTAHKKAAHSTSKARVSSKKTFKSAHPVGSYHHQRDLFFATHTNAQMLLGIFIVSVAIYIGVMIWGQLTMYSAEVSNPGTVQASF